MAPSIDIKPVHASTESKKKLPVTILSGFLGSGKTTLLQNILSGDHGLRIAVIVNDIGEFNVDGALIGHHASKTTERLVQLQNGCICCSLRGDLLEEVANLASKNVFDYLVAETFAEEFSDMMLQAAEDLKEDIKTMDVETAKNNAKVAQILAAGGLPSICRLDCCVTVIDAASLLDNFDTHEFLIDRFAREDVPEEDDRDISNLCVDQIEFAQRIIINKVDLVSKKHLEKVRHLVKTLNPGAKVLESVRGQIDLNEILNTGSFSYAEAALSAGWLKSLNEEVIPETEEYQISTFTYRQRRPFHPERLWKAVRNVFVVIQTEYMDDGCDMEQDEGEEENADDDDDEDADMSEGDDDGADDAGSQAGSDSEAQPQLNPAARLAAKKANKTWKDLFRSKGFFWVATRPYLFGEWSSAGLYLTLNGGGRWRCELPREMWPQDPEIIKSIEKDFQAPWGDRRQELVFIGQNMKPDPDTPGSEGAEVLIRRALEECLLTDEEWAKWQRIMQSTAKGMKTPQQKQRALDEWMNDGFEDWDEADELNQDHTGHNH
ncbi:unnamed protein product [Tilletia controversa]|uniref:CobW C-terminal domain-containing protein n=3 Tax=Tilletia TaxID=13289 RepID=A0A8X7SXK6_9BASI|nr:hypothetical protein CF336_g4357 [Tilletia laevis]KAE8195305.1 hypothetical protein CF328_g4478 [Tilletia controversa]KAE8263468.1 hypothetical protein A4X03_0g1657 [Tilletia caries]KAE8199801.1 hypothetical protein CF335_g4084 [Tilletia laevis]KAE8248531.1 hypothetical protein A4X06_0g3639 [Tilletia controversa]